MKDVTDSNKVSKSGFDVAVNSRVKPLMDNIQKPFQCEQEVSLKTDQNITTGCVDSKTHTHSDEEDSVNTIVLSNDYQFDSEVSEQKLVRKLVKAGMTVFDVGAHLGKYTKLLSLLVGENGRVYAFEPTGNSFKKLDSAIKQLGCTNVTLINKAVYSENCNVVINEFPEEFSSWNSLGLPMMKNPQDTSTLVSIEISNEVEAVTLDSFCQQHKISKIDYLKLDVEGSELNALIGTSELLEKKAISYLQFEISKQMLCGLNTKAKYIFDFLESKGYECYTIDEDGNAGEKVSDSSSFYENYISFPSNTIPSELISKPENKDRENKHKINTVTGSFTDGDLWTPQTYMQRAIKDWLNHTSFEPDVALSIDKNPLLDAIIMQRWPKVEIKHASCLESDALDLSKIADNQYDMVYSNQILEHIPKPWAAASEMVRVLKPGGLGLHTTCAFNPRHGLPKFNDYYRFLPDGLAELFEGVEVLVKAGWGNRQVLLYNLAIDDGHGELGGRRFCEQLGKRNDEQYPWLVWIIFEKC